MNLYDLQAKVKERIFVMKKFILLLAVCAMFVVTASSVFAANSPDITKYTATYSTGSNGELIITNTYSVAKKDISVIKQWDDDSNRDNYRPLSVCVELKANGIVVDNYTLSGTGNSWSYVFTNKVVYNEGTEITYSVSENGLTCTALPTPTDQNTCQLSGGNWNSSKCTMPN